MTRGRIALRRLEIPWTGKYNHSQYLDYEYGVADGMCGKWLWLKKNIL